MHGDPPDRRAANVAWLRRRNALWAELRLHEANTEPFERALTELSRMTRWPRERILAGLGITTDTETGPSGEHRDGPAPASDGQSA